MPGKDSRRAKLARKAKKAVNKERRQRQRQRESSPPISLLSGLDEAEQLLNEGNLDDAVEVLEELQRRYPRRPQIMGLLLEAHLRQQDMWSYQAVCQRLLELDVAAMDIWLALAGAALSNGQMATAYQAFVYLLNRWPDNPEADRARVVRDDLAEFLRGEVAKAGMPQDDGFDLLILHDQINLHLHQGEYDRVCEAAKRLLNRFPTFAPALNNRSEAYFRSGRIDLAIADARRVLEFDADNFHAIGNLTRFLYLSAQFEEASREAQRLKATKCLLPDCFVKQAEALVFLGDWSAVLDALRGAEEHGDASAGLLYHLAGAAAAELGQTNIARKHWKHAIKLQAAASWAQQNLNDLNLPVGEQNGPWAFPLEYWIPRPVMKQLMGEVERAGPKAKDTEVRRRVRKFLAHHKYLEQLMPQLLERGDPVAKEFVVRLASLIELSPIFSAVRQFAFGRRGSDELRYRALTVLIDAEILSPGQHRMWMKGELCDVNCMRFEISPEPTDSLPRDVEPLLEKARQALHDGDGATAESLLDEALRCHPDHPSIAYNRSVAIQLQGREEEAVSLVRSIHARHPDYLFARTRLAEEAAKCHNFAAARDLLDPLMQRKRFHLSEYVALCCAYIQLFQAEGEMEGARRWLSMWEDVDPDDPRIRIIKSQLRRRGPLGWIGRQKI